MCLEIEKRRKEIEQNKRNKALEFTKNEEEIKECIQKCVQAKLEKEYGDQYLSLSPAKKVEPSAGTQQSDEHLNTLSSVMKKEMGTEDREIQHGGISPPHA